MKNIIFCLLIFTSTSHLQAQIIRTQYDSLQDKKMELVQEQLKKFHGSYMTGVSFFYVGAAVSTMSLLLVASEGTGSGLVFAGSVSMFVGSTMMIWSHREIGKAGRLRRKKPLTEYP